MTATAQEWAAFLVGVAVGKGKENAKPIVGAAKELGLSFEERVRIFDGLSVRKAPDCILGAVNALQ